jgi:hypothetical protein
LPHSDSKDEGAFFFKMASVCQTPDVGSGEEQHPSGIAGYRRAGELVFCVNRQGPYRRSGERSCVSTHQGCHSPEKFASSAIADKI